MNSEHSHPVQCRNCVLLVDDNDDLRQMLCLALETAGFEVIDVASQIELQRRLAHIHPDAVVLNLQRSEADGLPLLTRMRARQNLSNVPILFLSGVDDLDLRFQVLSAGADWFGVRPIGMIELQKRVGELVRNGRPAATLVRGPRAGPRVPRILRLRKTG